MPLSFHTDVVDNGLNEIVSEATTVFVCSALPDDYAEANTIKLGSAPISFNAPEAETGGRKITSDPITGGTVTTSGTVSHWAVCDASRLLAAGEIDAAEAVTSGWEFSLGALSLAMPYGLGEVEFALTVLGGDLLTTLAGDTLIEGV